MIENNPSDALLMLDSIANPQDMDEELYMQYIIMRIRAKYKVNNDISGDTAIFSAQKYFEKNKNEEWMLWANYYSANVCYEANNYSDALMYSFKAQENARKSKKYLLLGGSFQKTGDIYFNRNKPDSAIINFKQAIDYYNNLKDADTYKLQVLNQIGLALNIQGKIDLASVYFAEGLELAKEIGNKEFEASFNHRLGYVMREKKIFDKASRFLHKALNITANEEESVRIKLSLAILKTKINQLDSAQFYINTVEQFIPEVNDNYVLRSIYDAIADYHRQNGDYEDALRYNDLYRDVDEKINRENSSEKLEEMDKQYKLSLKDKEMKASQMQFYLFLSILVVVMLSLVSFLYIRSRNIRFKHLGEIEKSKALEARNQLLATQNELLKKQTSNSLFLESIYQEAIRGWEVIGKKIDTMAVEYGADKRPEIFIEIGDMIENLRIKTNEQFAESAKDYFRSKPDGEKAISGLNNKELVHFLLCINNYSVKDIAIVLKEYPNKKNQDLRKIGIRNKLTQAGVYDKETEKILFPKKCKLLESE